MVTDKHNTGLELPVWLRDEIDGRRPSTQPRSEWIRQACVYRLAAEDNDEWETPAIEPTAPEA